MTNRTHRIILSFAALLCVLGGCSTAPKQGDAVAFMDRARSTTGWFERHVSGLSSQIDGSAGYVVFPDVAQWGILIGGGTFGRGALCEPNGRQIGWAALNIGSVGLQAGVQGFRALMVLEDDQTVNRFMANQLAGSMAGVAVLGESGGSASAPFKDGVVIYEGANAGLMAGVNIGLNYIRYQPLESGESPGDARLP